MSLCACPLRGAHRAAVDVRLDDDDAEGEPAEYPVSPGEMMLERRRAEGKLRDEASPPRDLACETNVLGGIDDVDAAAQHGRASSPARESALVRGCVDAARETAHDVHAALRELPRESGRRDQTAPRRPARTDDTDHGPRKRPEIPFIVEERGRRSDLAEEPRVGVVRDRNEPVASRLEPSKLVVAERAIGCPDRALETPAEMLPSLGAREHVADLLESHAP